MDINIEKQTAIKRTVNLIVSESIVRGIFKKSGYNVIKGTSLKGYLKARGNYFKDGEQMQRIEKCLKICDFSKKEGLPENNYLVGIPDYFVFNDDAEFFIEVKSNKSFLKNSQKRTFPLIDKIIPIKIARMNVEFNLTSQGIVIYNLSEQEIIKTKTIEKIKEIMPDLKEDKINKIFDIVNNKKDFRYDLLDLDPKKEKEEVILYEKGNPIEYDDDDDV